MRIIYPPRLAAAALALALLFSVAGCCSSHQHSRYGVIHAAAKAGDAAAVSAELAQHPEELNSRDDLEQTPLHIAAAQCHSNVVALLLARGADVNAKAKGGPTPLHLAAQEGCADAANLLLACHAKVNPRDDADRTPLKRAKQWHRDAMVQLLKQHGGTE
jgi:ankyrin repeat protein